MLFDLLSGDGEKEKKLFLNTYRDYVFDKSDKFISNMVWKFMLRLVELACNYLV